MIELTVRIDVKNSADLARKHAGVLTALLSQAALKNMVEGKIRDALLPGLRDTLTRELDGRGVEADVDVV